MLDLLWGDLRAIFSREVSAIKRRSLEAESSHQEAA
jgi:hypothetical protein